MERVSGRGRDHLCPARGRGVDRDLRRARVGSPFGDRAGGWLRRGCTAAGEPGLDRRPPCHWRDRHAELAGVAIDRVDHTLTYAGKSLRLTRREADLLDFLLRHPRRPFTSKQLATLAWQNSRLSDAQVRTYIMRLRSRLREVGLEEVITVVRNRGYGIAAAMGLGAER